MVVGALTTSRLTLQSAMVGRRRKVAPAPRSRLRGTNLVPSSPPSSHHTTQRPACAFASTGLVDTNSASWTFARRCDCLVFRIHR